MNTLSLFSWNVKGIKSPRKRRVFWKEVKEDKTVGVLGIQEHHLDTSCPKKQAIGRKLVLYGHSTGKDSGVLMIVDTELEPEVVVFASNGRASSIQSSMSMRPMWQKLEPSYGRTWARCR